ncbi:BON domain-containing protein [soil metagenome]
MKTDNQLRDDVLTELAWEPSVDSAHIGVTAEQGIVTLSGQVRTYMEKSAAERATERVRGVKGVAEKLEIKFGTGNHHNDTEIAQAAITALKWNDLVPNDKVQVIVEKGVVTLKGQVDWNYQREAATNAVRYLNGVTSVGNQMTLTTTLASPDLEAKIKQSFQRNAQLDADQIHATTQAGQVTLTGTVRSWAERRDAADVAWAALGVSDVHNNLVIA